MLSTPRDRAEAMGTSPVAPGAVQRAGTLYMVSWIYSEILGAEIWTGVTLTGQSGPSAGKMVLASRIQEKSGSVLISPGRTLCSIFSRIVRVKTKFEHFQKNPEMFLRSTKFQLSFLQQKPNCPLCPVNVTPVKILNSE